VGVYRVRMPQLGESVEEGTVVTWLAKAGSQIAEGEPLLEISTDKVDTEVESTVAGTLTRILVEADETVPVGTVLAEIEVEGLEDGPAEADDGSTDAEVTEAAEVPAAPEPPAATPAGPPADALPRQDDDHGLLLSPVVRRMVDEHGIDLADLAGFADGPRVDRKVVERYLAARSEQDAPDDGTEVIRFSRIRKLTAERMVASKATSPHVVTGMEVDFERVAAVRAASEQRLTWLPFVACAVARTLGRFERLNASVRDDALVVHRTVHLGIAVDLDGEGLVVPVLHEAQDLGLRAMAERIGDAAERARAGRLLPADITGGTFTITGQGPHGTLFTAPIINQPQVAILSVDGIRRRPVVVGDDIVAHHTGVLALSWDHRAVDGTYAAAFLAAVRDEIEQADWAAELA
jgi:pyruvate dehydrogenase E2 component (dihydrolipoamide acetyltransferase)